MTKNIYYSANPALWSHGDEMSAGREATLNDTWEVWETWTVDQDGYGVSDWIDDIRRSDYLNDLSDEAMKELMRLIAVNRSNPEYQNLVMHTKDYIESTLEI